MGTCKICNQSVSSIFTKNTDYISGEIFSIVLCSQCGTLRTEPTPSDISRYYPLEYYGKNGLRFPKPIELLIYISRLLRAKRVKQLTQPKGTIVDMGCGRGVMLSILKEQGFKTVGTEYSESAAKYPRDKGLDIRVSQTLSEANIEHSSIDTITLYHVFEHIDEPMNMLKDAYDALKEGGYLVIEVPNAASWQAQLTKGRWLNWDAPRHFYHFTPLSLSQVVREAGFSINQIETHSFEFGYYSFLQSLQNMLTGRMNILYDLLKYKLSLDRLKFYSKSDLFIVLTTLPFLLLISLILEPLAALQQRGSIVRLTAQKINR